MMFDNTPRQTTNAVLDIKEKAVEIVRSRGPVLPVQITKELGINVMFASALLSELVDNGTLRISNTKVGGSPVYYVSGQEAKLQALRDKLNDKQQRAFDLLKQSKVLRDVELEPVIRVALRDIKDFAHPLKVTAGPMQEIFWKWYLVSDNEAESEIKEKIESLEKTTKKETPKQKDVQQELNQIENELKRLEEQKKSLMAPVPIEHKIKEEVLKEEKREIIEENKEESPIQKENKEVKEKKPRKKSIKEESVQSSQSTLVPENKSEIDESDSFMMKVISYFNENKIVHSDIKMIRKESDFEGVVKIPTPVGQVTYFLKAKNKQKITDADLSLLFVQSQIKKMPILLITTGDTTKKAQEMLNNEFKNITLKKIN